mgnify:CR=1 FL=1
MKFYFRKDKSCGPSRVEVRCYAAKDSKGERILITEYSDGTKLIQTLEDIKRDG